jgi:hypothetical protein
MNPYEQPSPVPETNELEKQKTDLAAINSIQPTGDLVADVRQLDEENEWEKRARSSSSENLKWLVVHRYIYGKEIESARYSNDEKELFQAKIAAATRILEHYGVTAQTGKEFDNVEMHKPDHPLMVKLAKLEAFEPTGDIRKDALAYFEIKDGPHGRSSEVIQSGEREARDILLMVLNDFEQGIQRGPADNDIQENRIKILELFPKHRDVIVTILAKADSQLS